LQIENNGNEEKSRRASASLATLSYKQAIYLGRVKHIADHICHAISECACVCVCGMWSILRHFRSFFGLYFLRRRRRSVMGWHVTKIDHSPWVGWRRKFEVKEPGRSKCHRLHTNNRWWHSLLSRLIFTVLIPSSLHWESVSFSGWTEFDRSWRVVHETSGKCSGL